MYLTAEHEIDEDMNGLQKHALEVLIGLILAVGAFIGVMTYNISDRLARVETNVEHINKAVNNTSDDQQTLRELVESNCWSLSKLTDNYQKKC